MSAMTLVTGVYATAEQASTAIDALASGGIPKSDISVLVAENARLDAFGIQKQSKAAEGAAIGGGIGGAVGAAVVGFTAVGALATGGLGVIAAGPIVAALAGAGAGAAAGGALGGLIGLGIPEHRVEYYRDALKQGSVLLGVTVPDADASNVERIMKDSGAQSVSTHASRAGATPPAAYAAPGVAPTTYPPGARPRADGNGLRDLFVHQLKDMYYAERQILAALPAMRDKADAPELAAALDSHLAETRGQLDRLERVFRSLGLEPKEEKCPAINGIISEAKDLMRLDSTPAERDAAMICGAQKVEHYEIATYGCLRAYAEQLGETEAATLLSQNLEEEAAADQKLTELAERVVNVAAAHQPA